MEISVPSLQSAVSANMLTTTQQTTVSNITPSFSSLDKLFSAAVNRTLSLSNLQNTVEGFLTGRRPSSGQLYPRGNYNK